MQASVHIKHIRTYRSCRIQAGDLNRVVGIALGKVNKQNGTSSFIILIGFSLPHKGNGSFYCSYKDLCHY